MEFDTIERGERCCVGGVSQTWF